MKTIDFDVENDREFFNIVSDILINEDFEKLSNYVHHNSNRLQHSLNVSYLSYKISKRLNLDYKKISRAALLHDFFFIDNESISRPTRLKTLFEHPKYALDNSLKYFELSDMEKNIIITHMFPFGKYVPRYKESLIVNAIDDYVSVLEERD